MLTTDTKTEREQAWDAVEGSWGEMQSWVYSATRAVQVLAAVTAKELEKVTDEMAEARVRFAELRSQDQ